MSSLHVGTSYTHNIGFSSKRGLSPHTLYFWPKTAKKTTFLAIFLGLSLKLITNIWATFTRIRFAWKRIKMLDHLHVTVFKLVTDISMITQTVLLSIFFLTTTTNSAHTVNVFLVYTKSTQLRFGKSSLWWAFSYGICFYIVFTCFHVNKTCIHWQI